MRKCLLLIVIVLFNIHFVMAMKLNQTLDVAYKRLRAEGVKAIYLLPGHKLYLGTDGTIEIN